MKSLRFLLPLALWAGVAGAQGAPPMDASSITIDRVVAVVGQRPILWSEVLEIVQQRRAQGQQIPQDSAGQMAVAKEVLEELIDEEVLLMRAKVDSVEVTDDDVRPTVEAQMRRLREQFRGDAELAQALKGGGFGSIEEYRRWLSEQARRRAIQERVIAKMRQDGKVIPVPVSEAEVNEAFEKNRNNLPQRPATVTFRQIVVAPQPSPAAKERARMKAESLLAEVNRGSDFEQVAKRESMDPTSKDLGGDLGWHRRGAMVPEFERWMFGLRPGVLSPVFETSFGFHVIRVDRRQPAEVKVRHILIKPDIDSAQIAAARLRADSARTLWQGGAQFDTLVARFHDPDEEKGSLQPFERAQLPESYRTAFEGQPTGAFVPVFPIEDPRRGAPKFVVAQVIESNEGGQYTLSDFRTAIRDQLAQERSLRRVLDQLRGQTFVSIRL